MFKNILVPLDGSLLAEKALPFALKLADRLHTCIILARVIEVPDILTDNLKHQETRLKNAEEYFNEITKVITNSAFKYSISPKQVRTAIAFGEPKSQLIQIASICKADLIVMTTHGYSFPVRFSLGSVASHLLKHINTSVILIRPPETEQTTGLVELLSRASSFDNIDKTKSLLVVLNGTPDEEIIVKPAIALARQLNVSIKLLEVISNTGTTDAPAQNQPSGSASDLANNYLERLRTIIEKQGVKCFRAVRVGQVLSEIEQYTKTENIALLVMPAFGSLDTHRMMVGSIAEEVVRKTHFPVMIIHPELEFDTAKPGEKLVFY
jgi:nucleotide-binding universal stress UspA family protein